jgi:hypothetical protein
MEALARQLATLQQELKQDGDGTEFELCYDWKIQVVKMTGDKPSCVRYTGPGPSLLYFSSTEFNKLIEFFPQLMEWLKGSEHVTNKKKQTNDRPLLTCYRYKLINEDAYTVEDLSAWFYSKIHALEHGIKNIEERKGKAYMVMESQELEAPSCKEVLIWTLVQMINVRMTNLAKDNCEACRINHNGQVAHMERGCLMPYEEILLLYFHNVETTLQRYKMNAIGLFKTVIRILELKGKPGYETNTDMITEMLNDTEIYETCRDLGRNHGQFDEGVQTLLDTAYEHWESR